MKKMKTILCSGFAAALVGGVVLSTNVFAEDKVADAKPAADAQVAKAPSEAEAKKVLSFSHGYQTAQQLIQQAGDMVDSAEFVKGIEAAFAEQENPYSQAQAMEAMKKLTAQAAFLQAFAENVAEEERPIEEVAPKSRGGEIDFGWRAGLSW